MELVVVFAVGFLAAGVDGALGMGFGPTSSALLLGSGMHPLTASAVVNVAKFASGLAGAGAHWRYGNIDRALVTALAVPGAVGAVAGVTVLANVDPTTIRPVLAVGLMVIGLRILLRTALDGGGTVTVSNEFRAGWRDRVIGAAGGCANGMIGAWGPIVTPYLLHRRVPPRVAIGSVTTAEVAIAVVSFGTFVASDAAAPDAGVTIAMLAGAVLAAPLAARIVSRIDPRLAAIGLAAMLLLTQTRELATAAELGMGRWGAYAVVIGVVGMVTVTPMRHRSRPGRAAPVEASPTPADRG